ncbi:hypothetical protein L596_010302 [Steinernema carpocapsae]|uniref:Protein kinase domain-containing protein n=1 Tax=Steinernema carpocapsae TaxID=34508 RepID=A0A4U5PJ93_STECR|nr:hypothetical protein L596_010302 [Steinernema carpocapsae]
MLSGRAKEGAVKSSRVCEKTTSCETQIEDFKSNRHGIVAKTSKEPTTTTSDTLSNRTAVSTINARTAIPVPASPAIYSPAALRKAAEGVARDVERVEVFDPIFYVNQVPMNEHESWRRPKWGARRNKDNCEAERVYRVRARQVGEVDTVERIKVHQLKYCGSGAFSDVYIGYVSKESEPHKQPSIVAIKKIWPDNSREEEQIVVQRRLRHQNILKVLFYYVCVHPKTKLTMWSMILELMPSTVSKEHQYYIERGRLMPEIHIKMWMYQLFCGLAYLEKRGYFHRDIKPDNLLVDKETGVLKIADFGATKKYREHAKNHTYHVTRYYRAPELCLKYERYDPTIDVWAAGCIVMELLVNRIIFPGKNSNDQIKQIIRVIGTPTLQELEACVPGKQVPESLLHPAIPKPGLLKFLKKYNKRATAVNAHFADSILRYDCNERLRGKAALVHPFFDILRSPKARMPGGNPLPPLQYINFQ